MALLKININDPLMKAIKAFNTITGNSLTEEDLKKQRSAMELAGKLAAPKGEISIEPFQVGNIKCEMISPDLAHNPRYVILYAHGGGYVCGGLGYARIIGAKLALATGFTVVSFEYRLAPENKFPAPIDDGEIVWNYLLEKGYGANHILMAGDSAGGHLVLSLTQRLLGSDRKPPRALILISPWTDMTATTDSYKTYKTKDPILTYEYVVGVRDAFIGTDVDPAQACYSPLNGDVDGFPHTLIMVGKNEILLDDSVKLHKKLQKAHVNSKLDIEKNGWHVYQQHPIPIASRAMHRIANYIVDEIYGY